MRKMFALLAACFVVAIMPLAAVADLDDGAACDAGTAAPATMGNEQDRASVCASAGGFTAFYLGGEAQAEEAENRDGFPTEYGWPEPGLCGSVTVLGQAQGSGHSGGTGPGGTGDWNWDHTHPGPDGILGTADDEIHEHDCQ